MQYRRQRPAEWIQWKTPVDDTLRSSDRVPWPSRGLCPPRWTWTGCLHACTEKHRNTSTECWNDSTAPSWSTNLIIFNRHVGEHIARFWKHRLLGQISKPLLAYTAHELRACVPRLRQRSRVASFLAVQFLMLEMAGIPFKLSLAHWHSMTGKRLSFMLRRHHSAGVPIACKKWGPLWGHNKCCEGGGAKL